MITIKSGQVKWFDTEAGEGVIISSSGKEIKVQSAAVVPSEGEAYSRIQTKKEALPAGADVNFELADEGDLTASEVIQLN